MEQIETQVSDLRFLTQTAAPAMPLAPGHGAAISPRHPSSSASIASPLSAPPGDNSAQPSSFSPGARNLPPKRKPDSEDAGAKQQRSKRNRYIAIACNECKRRKIKCNGETPCQRCGNLNLACLYSPNCCSDFRESDEYKQITNQVGHLQEQVDTLLQNVNALRQETLRLAPLQERILPLPASTLSPSPSISIPPIHKPGLAPLRQPPSYRGPTSIAFTVDVAKNTLHNMGYSGVGDGHDESGTAPEETPNTSPIMQPVGQGSPPKRPRDPLWDFDKDEMVRLCRVHEDEVGIMYPVVNIESVIAHARSLASWMESAKRHGLVPPYGQDEGINDLKTLQLKIIMCCALAVEEHGNSEKARRLYDSLQPIADRKLMSDPSEFANLPFLALLAGYRFLSNDEVLAWRVMGQVARHCLELGLHRREALAKIPDEQDRKNAINTFWSAYVLDRRWSFGTGLPYVVHDDKIDPKLPLPDEYPYLVAMITYSQLGAKIWKLVDFFEPAIIRDLKREEFETLDQEILEWYDKVPEDVKISNFDKELPLPSTPSYNLQRLQIWTRLRLNQIRIWLHTPVLHSASSIHDNMPLAQKAVDLAKDTIQYLMRLNNHTNLYRRIQVFYHQFLTSAIAVLFLASTHAPLQFSANCRAEFYMALELVKDMSAKSWVSQRLWRTVRSLKAYAPRLGMQQDEDPHNSAALAMAGMATSTSPHFPAAPVASRPSPSSVATPTTTFGRLSQMPSSTSTTPSLPQRPNQPLSGDQANGLLLQSEMTRIFEGYMGMNGLPVAPAGDLDNSRGHLPPPANGNGGNGLSSAAGGYTSDDGLYHHFRDMF